MRVYRVYAFTKKKERKKKTKRRSKKNLLSRRWPRIDFFAHLEVLCQVVGTCKRLAAVVAFERAGASVAPLVPPEFVRARKRPAAAGPLLQLPAAAGRLRAGSHGSKLMEVFVAEVSTLVSSLALSAHAPHAYRVHSKRRVSWLFALNTERKRRKRCCI